MADAVIGVLSAADQAAIRAVSDRFSRLLVAQDFDSLIQLYTESTVFMPPHQAAVHGRTALRAWLASFPKVSRFSFSIDEVDGRADLAYVRGSYTMTVHPDGADSIDDLGKFIEIRKRQADGSWLIAADIFNSDRP